MPRTAPTIPRLVPRFMGGSTLFNGSTSRIVVATPETLPTDQFSVTFMYKTKARGGLTASIPTFAPEEGWFSRTGSINANRQGTNDFQIYAYLNAPSDYATPRRLRFRGFYYPNGDGRWHFRTYNFYVVGGYAKCDEYEDCVKLGSTHTVDYTGDANTPAGNLNIGYGESAGFNGFMSEVKFHSRVLTTDEMWSVRNGELLGTELSDRSLDDLNSTYIDSIAGNNGTGTATTYSPDTPIQQRVAVSDDKASLRFDGVDDYVNIPFKSSLAFDNLDQFTAQVVLKNTKSGLVQRILAQGLEILMRTTASNTYEVIFNSFSTNDRTSGGFVNLNKWDDVVMQFDGTKIKLFQNGKKVSEITPTGTYGGNVNAFAIGISAGEVLSSIVKSTRIWNTALTHQQIRDLHFNKIVPTTGLVLNLTLNEGAGTIAYDSSGNGNDGTITGATWSSETPSKARPVVGGNLVKNGDFEYAPPFTAATTTNNRVVDGTAAGAVTADYPSEAKKLFNWKMNAYVVTNPAVQYEDGALKVSGVACKERVNLTLGNRVYSDLNVAADIQNNLIPVLPNTSYTISLRMKTEIANAVGTAGVYGAQLRLEAHSAIAHTGTIFATGATDNDKIGVTTDWTTYQKTFTTSATTRYLNVYFGIFGSGTSYADITAWFDDITLTKTTPDTRPSV